MSSDAWAGGESAAELQREIVRLREELVEQAETIAELRAYDRERDAGYRAELAHWSFVATGETARAEKAESAIARVRELCNAHLNSSGRMSMPIDAVDVLRALDGES
jgi:hypothetical protein